MKKKLILTVILVSVLTLGFSQTKQWTVSNESTWINAVNGIRTGGNNMNHNIVFSGSISVPMSDGPTFGSVTGVTVTLEGSGSITPSSNGALLRIGSGQIVIVRNLTLQGRINNNSSVVRIMTGGTFRMQGRASVTDNSAVQGSNTSGVYVNGGTFFMEDNSSVTNNTTKNERGGADSGGVRVDDGGTFTMKGGTISGNTVIGTQFLASNNKISVGIAAGGGVSIGENCTFNMHGGIITRNTATSIGGQGPARAVGGGVCVMNGTFNMQGGTITANTAKYDNSGWKVMGGASMWSASGGGVYIEGKNGSFIMQDGTITRNNTNSAGGGVFIHSGTFTMNNGSISGNISPSSGAGVDVHGSFIMVNGDISSNTGTGVDVYDSFTMKGGKISGNGGPNCNGGGVCINSGTFTMENGEISSSTASAGGGVYLKAKCVFNKNGGIIYGNDAAQNTRNTLVNKNAKGHVVYDDGNNRWRNATAGIDMNTTTYGFWIND